MPIPPVLPDRVSANLWQVLVTYKCGLPALSGMPMQTTTSRYLNRAYSPATRSTASMTPPASTKAVAFWRAAWVAWSLMWAALGMSRASTSLSRQCRRPLLVVRSSNAAM